jgi:hypothetical protein
MFTPEHYRAKAAEYGELARMASDADAAREFQRRERSFTDLADNEQWLVDHQGKTLHAADAGGADQAIPEVTDAAMAAAQQ